MKKLNLYHKEFVKVLFFLFLISLSSCLCYVNLSFGFSSKKNIFSQGYNLKPGLDYKRGEILIKYKRPLYKSKVYYLASKMKTYSLIEVEKIPTLSKNKKIKHKFFLLKVNKNSDIIKACKELTNQNIVEYAEPNYIYHHTTISTNDPLVYKSWSTKKIKVDKVWKNIRGDENIIIAVLDTGCDLNHEDLKNNIISPKNFIGKETLIDKSGHGTHIAGIITAVGNNNKGIRGIASQCKIMPVKVGTGTTIFSLSAFKGIIYAANKGVSIINMSWGGRYDSLALHDAIKYAYSKNVTLVAAAGNNNESAKNYVPAKYPETITVAATNTNDKKASFSNYGKCVDVAAPGVEILSTTPGNNYEQFKGTSMSAAQVTGLAALIKSIKPKINNKKVRKIIKYSSDKIITDKPIGKGRINAFKTIFSISSLKGKE